MNHAICTGGHIFRDDKPPHIDAYGLAMMASLYGRLETLHFDEDDPQHKANLAQLMDYAERITNRY